MTGHDGHVLLAVFAVHNMEELVTASRIPLVEDTLLRRTGLDPGHLRTDRVALAMAALTGAAGILLRDRAPRHRGQAPPRVGPSVVAGALAANAAAHLGRSLRTRRWNPGLATAPAVAAAAVAVLRRTGQGRPGVCALATLTGAAASVPATVLALRSARAVRP